MKNYKYLLIQARTESDPMAKHEQFCFSRTLQCHTDQIKCIDIIREVLHKDDVDKCDAVLIGGSGDYSIAQGGSWMKKVLSFMRFLYRDSKVTFASCWGFQAMAKALGGEVKKDLDKAELGTTELFLTQDGKHDTIFQKLPEKFLCQMGHEDIVTTLPKEAILLASSKKVKNEAFKFKKKPIYCTQFHPELNKLDLKKRMETYPNYINEILGISQEDFISKKCIETKDTHDLIFNFINEYIN